MSFGYYDKDWIEPPDPDYEVDDSEIVLEFNNDQVQIQDGEIIGFENLFDDFYDKKYDIEIADAQELADCAYEEIVNRVPEVDGSYTLSGWIYIPYAVYVPLKLNRRRRDWEEDLIEFEVLWDQVVSKDIVFTAK